MRYELSQVGAACPDHLVHTKRLPLFVDWNPETGDVDAAGSEVLKSGIAAFKEEYKAYFERNKNAGDAICESAPRVILIPGIGMVNTGKNLGDVQGQRRLVPSSDCGYAGATALGDFVSLTKTNRSMLNIGRLSCTSLRLPPAEAEFSRQVGFRYRRSRRNRQRHLLAVLLRRVRTL